MKNKESINILCYGDSNTFGYQPGTDGGRYPKEKRWTSILSGLLGSGYDITVEGLTGRTTSYDRVDQPENPWKNGYYCLAPCLASHKPLDVVCFMLGTNDCNCDMGLSAEDIALGMEKLLITTGKTCIDVQGYAPKIILVAPAYIRPEFAGTPFEYQLDETSVEKSRKLAPLYKALAEKHGCVFVDAGELEVSKLDCEHLTENGHKALAELVYNAVKSIDFSSAL